MKKTISLFSIILILMLALTSCGFDLSDVEVDVGIEDQEIEPDGNYKYPREFWGEWIRVDKNEKWKITSNLISKTGYPEVSNVNLTKLTDGIIKVTDNSGDKEQIYCIYAVRSANATITGKVRSMNNSRAVDVGGYLGNVAVTIENSKDKNDRKTITTDSTGTFTATELIPGEKYNVSVPGEKPITVVPKWDGENIGTITYSKGSNFKVSVNYSSNDLAYYADGSDYYCWLKITNIGEEDCLAATFEIEAEPGLKCTAIDNDSILGTIEAGASKSIKLRISSDRFNQDYMFRTLNIKINDTIQHKVWQDSVSFKFYQKPIDINIFSNGYISGVIMTDSFSVSFNGEQFSFSPGAIDHNFTVPWISSDYSLVFTGATASSEVKYSVGIECPAIRDFSSFSDPAAFEPNDTAAEAKTLSINQPIIAYLHKNDIDYYRFNVSNATPAYRKGYPGPAGGLIVYDKGNDDYGWRFIEAAPNPVRIVNGKPTISSQSGKIAKMPWGLMNDNSPCTSYSEGKGMYNTHSMLNSSLKDSESIALLCADLTYTHNGKTYDDWFIPSLYEIKLLKSYGYDVSDCWTSSTAHDVVSAYLGNGDTDSRSSEHSCYPIRYFSTETVDVPTIHHVPGSNQVTITCNTPEATIYYKINGQLYADYPEYAPKDYIEYTGPITLKDDARVISAYAKKKDRISSFYASEYVGNQELNILNT